MSGARRTLARAPSDVDSIAVTTSAHYNPQNPYQTAVSLSRYVIQQRALFSTTQFFTMAGPDGTKIGSDLSISCATIGDSDSKKMTIATPMVSVLVSNPPRSGLQNLSKASNRTGGRTDGRTDGRLDDRTDGRSDGRTDGRMDVRTYGRTDGRTNGRSDGRTDALATSEFK